MMTATSHSNAGALPPDVTGLTADSRQVRPGFLFAALPGSSTDGRRFIPEAIAKGASVILAETGASLPPFATGVTLLTDDRPRHRFAQIVAAYYGAQPRTVAAITGTNGKTSTTHFARLLWGDAGFQAATLGTLGLIAPDLERPGSLTTPDPIALHEMLRDLSESGVTHLAMEASSHGLDQFRLDGVEISIAGFIGLSRDHLDYHGTMTAYWAAKRRLFAELLRPGGTAVVNADTPQAADLADICADRGIRYVSFGQAGRDIQVTAAVPTLNGITLKLLYRHRAPRNRAAVGRHLPIDQRGMRLGRGHCRRCRSGGCPGRARPAARRAWSNGIGGDAPGRGRRSLSTTPTRPDALDTVLTALRPHVENRLICVFGCGGDRDRGKRPVMGGIVARLADIAIVTDDNPRTEAPSVIRAAVMAACPIGIEIGDRAEAIAAAVGMLQAGDILVIAGKGHEQGQEIGDEIRPFDDAGEARRAIAEITGGSDDA